MGTPSFEEGHANAKQLELLRRGKYGEPIDATAAERVYSAGQSICSRCHAKFRDQP
jgi:hypothetical protein